MFEKIYLRAYQETTGLPKESAGPLGSFMQGYFFGVIRALHPYFVTNQDGTAMPVINPTFASCMREVAKVAFPLDKEWEKAREYVVNLDPKTPKAESTPKS